jgi:multiple sugar transport system substrate-binding protein
MDEGNKNLNPTVPNRNIFEAELARSPSTMVGMTPLRQGFERQAKKEIVAKHRRFPKGIVFGLIGMIILLLVVTVIAKALSSRSTRNEPVTLVWWSLEEDVDAVNPIINEYQQANPNVKIQFVSESRQDYAERLANSLAQGKGPDIFEYHNTWVPVFRNNLSVTKEDFTSTFYPVVSSDLKTKDGFVGIPLEYDGIALFVNEDILHTYGKSAPKTWDDLRNLAQTLTIRDKSGIIQQAGAAIGVTSNIDYWQDILATLIFQNGGNPANPLDAASQSALTFYSNFFKTDRVWDETLPSSTTDFATGRLAMYFGLYHDAFTIAKQNSSLHFAVVPLPQLPSAGSNSVATAYANYWVNGVSNKAKDPAAAWNFLKFMSKAETLRELNANEKKVRGYGNLYPRVDMQKELFSDTLAGSFIYQAGFAKSWYLVGNVFDGPAGINSQVAKPYADAIMAVNGNSTADQATKDLQTAITNVLASYGLAKAPVATPQ